MKLALLLNAIDPTIGGALIMGHRGTGKSTAVRALADLLPPIKKVRGCLYGCDPVDDSNLCDDCRAKLNAGEKLNSERAQVPVVELPLGATEDRVCGAINIERALNAGLKAFEPGLLARAHRGFLYIDEVNLLEDHLVDLLLDVAVTGRNVVERESLSLAHPARFVLVGSGNPEEGELRPQLLDRFGLMVEVRTADDAAQRVEIVERREAFERDAAKFCAALEAEQDKLRRQLTRAQKKFASVKVPRSLLLHIAALCTQLQIDGHRGELTIMRAARALAALEGRREVSTQDVRRVATMALRHRLRRDPLEPTGGNARIEQALEQTFPLDDGQSKQAPPRIISGGEAESPGRGDAPRQLNPNETTTRRDSSAGKTTTASHGNEIESAPRVDSNGTLAGDAATTRATSALDAQLSNDKFKTDGTQQLNKKAAQRTQQRKDISRRKVTDARRGRYVRATFNSKNNTAPIALDATLRAALTQGCRGLGVGCSERQSRSWKAESESKNKSAEGERKIEDVEGKRKSENSDDEHLSVNAAALLSTAATPLPISALLSPTPDPRFLTPFLRFKQFQRKQGRLFIFAIDASGSMALNRIAQAKGALARLLAQSYVKRDRVALISFRERAAEILLSPSRSVTRAARLLDELCVGGATPLAAGLKSALEIARRANQKGMQEITLLVFTDGRANVPLRMAGNISREARRKIVDEEITQLGHALRETRMTSAVVDTMQRWTESGEGRALALKLGGQYLPLATKLKPETFSDFNEVIEYQK